MRTVNKQLTINKPVTVTFDKEDFVNVVIDPQQKVIYITTKYYNGTDSLDAGTVTISGTDYDTLTGGGITLILDENNVWPIIDAIRGTQ